MTPPRPTCAEIRRRSPGIFRTGNAGWPECAAVSLPPTGGGRSDPTQRPSRLWPASLAPGPLRDGRTVDCGESAPRSRRSWHPPPAKRGFAVPTAGAPVGWSKDLAHDRAANQGPRSGTHSADCGGISRPPRPGRHRPLRGGVSAAQSAASVFRWLQTQVRPPLHDIGRLQPGLPRRIGMANAVEMSLLLAGGSGREVRAGQVARPPIFSDPGRFVYATVAGCMCRSRPPAEYDARGCRPHQIAWPRHSF